MFVCIYIYYIYIYDLYIHACMYVHTHMRVCVCMYIHAASLCIPVRSSPRLLLSASSSTMHRGGLDSDGRSRPAIYVERTRYK